MPVFRMSMKFHPCILVFACKSRSVLCVGKLSFRLFIAMLLRGYFLQKCYKTVVKTNKYNDEHNTLRLFDMIQNFLFTKSEAKRDY